MADDSDDDNLSDIRKKIKALLKPFIGSRYPSAQFNRIMGKPASDVMWFQKLRESMPTYTTCESLPGYTGIAKECPSCHGFSHSTVKDVRHRLSRDDPLALLA